MTITEGVVYNTTYCTVQSWHPFLGSLTDVHTLTHLNLMSHVGQVGRQFTCDLKQDVNHLTTSLNLNPWDPPASELEAFQIRAETSSRISTKSSCH